MNTKPTSLTLQFSLTEACNLRCTHCYQESYKKEEKGLSDWIDVVNQFIDLCKDNPGRNGNEHALGSIYLTGGEPLFLPDLWPLMDYIESRHDVIDRLSVLTNGTIMTPEIAERIKNDYPHLWMVQISIDGNKKIHDSIRGEGNFDAAMRGIQYLTQANIQTSVSFTASKRNWKVFPEVYSMLCEMENSHLITLWSDRMIPNGQGQLDEVMTAEETRQYFQLMAGCDIPHNGPKISFSRGLQFNMTDGLEAYHCVAGESLIYVKADGTVYPCPRLPMESGNVYERSISDIFYNHPVFNQMREQPDPDGCSSCGDKKRCGGGLRCLSYAMYGDHDITDPGCWKGTDEKHKFHGVVSKKPFPIKVVSR